MTRIWKSRSQYNCPLKSIDCPPAAAATAAPRSHRQSVLGTAHARRSQASVTFDLSELPSSPRIGWTTLRASNLRDYDQRPPLPVHPHQTSPFTPAAHRARPRASIDSSVTDAPAAHHSLLLGRPPPSAIPCLTSRLVALTRPHERAAAWHPSGEVHAIAALRAAHAGSRK